MARRASAVMSDCGLPKLVNDRMATRGVWPICRALPAMASAISAICSPSGLSCTDTSPMKTVLPRDTIIEVARKSLPLRGAITRVT